MIAVTATLSLVTFAVALWFLGLAPAAAGALAIMRSAVATMRDPALGEEMRERQVQRASLLLLGRFFSILGRSLIAALLAIVPIWLADTTRIAAQEAVLLCVSRWDVILVTSAAMLAVYFLAARRRRAGPSGDR